MANVSLIENSYLFVNEALLNSRKSKLNENYFSFAILHLIQGLELMLKEVLRNEHPILIYENIDRPSHTCSLPKCLERLKAIGNIDISIKEETAIKRATAQRNKIVHHEYELIPNHQYAIFVQLFEFIHYFHQKHFGHELHDHISKKLWKRESELLAEFKLADITYKGKKIQNHLPELILAAQRYTTLRQTKGEDKYYFARIPYDISHQTYKGPCGDCGVDDGEYHVFHCDIEMCPICGKQLLMCIDSNSGCNTEYWLPKNGQKIEYTKFNTAQKNFHI